MPFGLTNAPATFQCLMENCMVNTQTCQPMVLVCIDFLKLDPSKGGYACSHGSLHEVRASLPHEKSNCMYHCKGIVR